MLQAKQNCSPHNRDRNKNRMKDNMVQLQQSRHTRRHTTCWFALYSTALFILFFSLSPNHVCSAPIEKNTQPNIVFILVDDMGYGDPRPFNADSKIEMPNIERLAAEGMIFTDAHASGPLCHVSRYGLLTGCYPFRSSPIAWNKGPTIKSDQETIASLLTNAGYSTAMIGKWHLGFERMASKILSSADPLTVVFKVFLESEHPLTSRHIFTYVITKPYNRRRKRLRPMHRMAGAPSREHSGGPEESPLTST